MKRSHFYSLWYYFLLSILAPLNAGKEDWLSYSEFSKKFRLGSSSTEQLHPLTQHLSTILQKNTHDGLNTLLEVDKTVISGFDHFMDTHFEDFSSHIKTSLNKGGKIILVGSGSSGRLAVDLASKAKEYCSEHASQFYDELAGGGDAFPRAKENFEDSEKDGREALSKYDLGKNDVIILISGSGSASFNVGAGSLAAEKGAIVFYFYNSTTIPKRTDYLFDFYAGKVIPLLVDIGPQAIAGSTRLQASTLGELCLGVALFSALTKPSFTKDSLKKAFRKCMEEIFNTIQHQIPMIATIAEEEAKVFSDTNSNFRKIEDRSNQAYVTTVVSPNALRESFTDNVELPPTYSLSKMQKESETKNKKPEYQTYLIDETNNENAYAILLGRPLYDVEKKDALQFIIAANAEGNGSYANRPKGKGNIVIGITKLYKDQKISESLLKKLESAKQEGATTILIIVAENYLAQVDKEIFIKGCHIPLFLENIPFDEFGIIPTLALKTILNLISNGAMILMNKVYGNQMIDVSASNGKLIDRVMRLTQSIFSEIKKNVQLIDDETLYYYVQEVQDRKKEKHAQGVYTPSTVKILLTLLYENKTPDQFEEVVDEIMSANENLPFLMLENA